MKNFFTILLLSFVLLLCTSIKSQTIVSTQKNYITYLNKDSYIKLKKMERFKEAYIQVQLNYKKNSKFMWVWSKKIIEDPYLNVRYDNPHVMTLIDNECLHDYNAILFRYKLVMKKPNKYKKFWNGWSLRYIRDCYVDIDKIKY